MLSTSCELGGTYIATYRGEEWPVVLCRSTLTPDRFQDTKRDDGDIAAILLGKRIYIWVREDALEDYDWGRNYLDGLTPYDEPEIQTDDDEDTRRDKQRRVAFRLDANLSKDDDFWANYIVQEQEIRKTQRQLKAKKQSCLSVQQNVDHVQQSDGPTSRVYYLGGFQILRRTLKPKRLPRQAPHREFSPERCATPIQVEEIELDQIRKDNEEWAKELPLKDDTCTVFVGRERKPYQIGLDHARSCTSLAAIIQRDDDRGFFADLSPATTASADSDGLISARDFVPILRFMQGDDVITHSPQEDGEAKAAGIEEEVERLAHHYLNAAKLGYVPLQLRICEQIQAMPLHPFTVLALGNMVYHAPPTRDENEADLGVRRWLADIVAKDYWEMAAGYTEILEQLLGKDYELRKLVFTQLIGEDPGSTVERHENMEAH